MLAHLSIFHLSFVTSPSLPKTLDMALVVPNFCCLIKFPLLVLNAFQLFRGFSKTSSSVENILYFKHTVAFPPEGHPHRVASQLNTL